MARNASNTVPAVDSARQTYIDSLNSQRDAALAEITAAQATIAEAQSAMEARTASAREVEAQLRSLGFEIKNPISVGRGRPAGSRNRSTGVPEGRTRHSNEVNLPDAILLCMAASPEGEQFNLDSILAGVSKAGYRSTSENPKVIVNQSLTRLKASKYVRRPERGQYALTASGRKAAAAVSENLSAAE